MEILLVAAFIAAVALPLHLLNRRDAEKRELAAALKSDPRLQIDLMCARDYQENRAARANAPAAANLRKPAAEEQRQAA